MFECEFESGMMTARLNATKSGRSKRQTTNMPERQICKRIGARVPCSHNNKQMYQSEYDYYETHWIDDNIFPSWIFPLWWSTSLTTKRTRTALN